MTEKIVLPDDPEAAEYRTDIRGWVSRHGLFFGDGDGAKHAARHDGCTHTRCKRCGAVHKEKYWGTCPACREQDAIARYNDMPRKEWDGEAMLYSDSTDNFYADLEEVEDSLEENGGTLADLRLIICEPVFVRQLEEDDFADQLPEDSDVPDELIKAANQFNQAVAGIQLSWRPGKYALRLDEQGGAQ